MPPVAVDERQHFGIRRWHLNKGRSNGCCAHFGPASSLLLLMKRGTQRGEKRFLNGGKELTRAADQPRQQPHRSGSVHIKAIVAHQRAAVQRGRLTKRRGVEGGRRGGRGVSYSSGGVINTAGSSGRGLRRDGQRRPRGLREGVADNFSVQTGRSKHATEDRVIKCHVPRCGRCRRRSSGGGSLSTDRRSDCTQRKVRSLPQCLSEGEGTVRCCGRRRPIKSRSASGSVKHISRRV